MEKINYFLNEYKFQEKNINCLYLNIRSMRANFDIVKSLIEEIKENFNQTIHVIALSEIWIYMKDNNDYKLENYLSYYSNNEDYRSGGCALFIHSSLQSTQIKQEQFEMSNFITVKLNDFDLDIACVYRNLNEKKENFINKLENDYLKMDSNMISLGDFNINILANDKHSKNYVNAIGRKGYAILNSLESGYFTRKGRKNGTYIDHVLTNQMQYKYNLTLTDINRLDHRGILLSFGETEKNHDRILDENGNEIFRKRSAVESNNIQMKKMRH